VRGVGPPWTSHQSLLTLPSFPAFARGEHLAGFLQPFSSRLWFLGASDPIEKFFLVRVSQSGKGGLRRLVLAKRAFRSSGIAIVRGVASSSITTATVPPAPALAPFCSSLFTIMECVPSPSGINEFRNGNPLMVPVTETRALLPNAFCTSNGIRRNVQAFPGPLPCSFTSSFCFI
jgi:hypothetical protein